MSLRLELFGSPRLTREGVLAAGRAVQRRRLALLILLARSPRRTMPREALLALLWADHSPDAARRLLSESVYVLRREFGEGIILSVADGLALAPHVACDVDEFLEHMASGCWELAVKLHERPFLDGWFVRDAPDLERWVEGERAALSAYHVRALKAIAEEHEANGRWPSAAEVWQSICRLDPYSSNSILRTARALVSAGEPAAALQALAVHETLLREELGVGLSDELSALAGEIREGRVRPQRDRLDDARTSVPPLEARESAPPAPITEAGLSSVVTRQVLDSRRDAWRPQRWSTRRFLASCAILAFLATLAWRIRELYPGPTPVAGVAALDPRRIAVLYFADSRQGDTVTYLADGLAEGLIRELVEVPTLHVLSRDAAARFRESAASADSVGRALHAGTVVSAALQRSEGKVRVVARLVEAATGEQFATVIVERPEGELFTLIDSLSLRTAVALRARLGDEIRVRSSRREVELERRSDRALELLFRAERLRKDAILARTNLSDVSSSLQTSRRLLVVADSLLAEAERIEPRFPPLALERGWVAVSAGLLEHGATRVVALAPGLAHAERAATLLRQLDTSDARTRAEVLYLQGVLWLRTATAVQTFRPELRTIERGIACLDSAIAIDASLAGAWAELSMGRWVMGDFEGAERAASEALAADAFLESGADVVEWAWRAAYSRADAEVGARWCNRGRQLFPDDWRFTECELTLMRLDAAGLTRRSPNAKRAWDLVRALESSDPPERARDAGRPYSPTYRRLVAAAVSAASGQRELARSVLSSEFKRVSGDAELGTDILYDAAFVHVTMGEAQRAGTLLGKYLRARPDLRTMLERDQTMRDVMPASSRVANPTKSGPT